MSRSEVVESLDDLDRLLEDQPIAAPTINVATRRSHRHRWGTPGLVGDGTDVTTQRFVPFCDICHQAKDEAKSRRGKNNRSRGNSIEREIAAALGLRRVGMYGGPEDVKGDYLIVQVKSGSAFPERVWKWLNAMTADANQTRAVVLTDAPGPGHRRRALVIVELGDWISMHGPTK